MGKFRVYPLRPKALDYEIGRGPITMNDYYIYQVDVDGYLATAFLARCSNDAAACIAALGVAEGFAEIEVWAGFRWVATWAPRKRWLH